MDRPRRSGRTSQAPASGYASPSMHHSTPSLQQSGRMTPNASSSRLNVPQQLSGAAYQAKVGMAAAGMPSTAMMAAGAYAQQHHAPIHLGNSAGANSFPLGKTPTPIPPQLPIGPGQAQFSTFASRAKAGVSTLIQPLPPGQDFIDPLRQQLDFASTDRAARGGRERRRAAANVRYYGDDFSDFEDSDDAGSATASPSKANTPLTMEEEEHQAGAWLGIPPPGNKTFAKRVRQPHPIAPSEADLVEQAEKRDFLIPIRIELETDGHRIKDTFSWNAREQIIKPRDFARTFVRDLDLPYEPYQQIVEQAIIDQVKLVEESGLDLVDVGPANGGPFASKDGEKRSRDSRPWNWGLKRRKLSILDKKGHLALEAPNDSEAVIGDTSAEIDAKWDTDGPDGEFEDDLRVFLEYDVQVYRYHLRDRLEWDLCSPLTPEAFATQLCKDLCLTGEATSIVANAVREQLVNHLRSIMELDLIGKGTDYGRWQQEIEDAEREIFENRKRRLQGLPSLPPKPLQVLHEDAEEQEEASLGPRRRRGIDGSGMPTPSVQPEDSSAAATPKPDTRNIILRTPEERKAIAEHHQRQLTERGPRRLMGAWREYNESKEFGPLLEFLTDDDLERIEADAMRASRRGRRDQQRSVGRRRR